MRYIFGLLLIFSVVQVKGQDFRNAYWGHTVKEVKTCEKYLKPSKTSADLLEYENIKIGLFDTDVRYSFTNNRLDRIKVTLRSKYLPISIMKDSNPNLNQILSLARRNEKLNRFIHKNGFDLGKWFHLSGDAWIKNREEISSELEKISEDYLFDIGWNGKQGIEEISRILEEKHITNPTYNSNSERTLIYIKFNLIDNLPDYLKKRHRNQIEQLKKYNKKGQHWQENLPIMEIDLSVRDGVIKDNDVGF